MRLGRWPLAVKLWGVFAALTLIIFGLLAILLPSMLKSFFTDQLFDILADSQINVQLENRQQGGTITVAQRLVPIEEIPASTASNETIIVPSIAVAAPVIGMGPAAQPNFPISVSSRQAISTTSVLWESKSPMVRHFVMSSLDVQAHQSISAVNSSENPFMTAIERDAFAQELPVDKYTVDVGNQSLFYVIKKEQVAGDPNYIVTYAWGNYRNDLVMTMFVRLSLLMLGLIVISWLPCMALAKYLTRPLVQMERHVGRLAERDWHEPLYTGRGDEIGRLSKAIESMRQRLVRQDKSQQFFLQNLSHELKTPVMIIRGYVQSIQDGIFPKGTLQGSLGVITKEALRLEKRIQDLLILNKLNYLSTQEKTFQSFKLQPIIEDTMERLKYRRPDITWGLLNSDEVEIVGDKEQWGVVFENLLDNQLRYAKSHISIAVTKPAATSGREEMPVIRLSNDGPAFDDDGLESLFEAFYTGKDGQFGLGLAIVRHIASSHKMTVRAANEQGLAVIYLEPAIDGT